MFRRFILLLVVASGLLMGCSTVCRTPGPDARKCLAFLQANMPAADRTAVPTPVLLENIQYALLARGEFAWARNVPPDIFLNDVLPYAQLDEARDPWRREFYEKFAPLVRSCATAADALKVIHATIVPLTKVNYNTRRRRANQSPKESMETGMASCTGLSILLADACRSVGIPARLTGVWTWSDFSGNHTWVEVWIDGKWQFTEYNRDPAGLDHGWMLDRLVNVDEVNPLHAVWAASFTPTADRFPLVWREGGAADVFAVNVSRRYRELARSRLVAKWGDRNDLACLRVLAHDAKGERVALRVTVVAASGGPAHPLASGVTSGELDDQNRHLDFYLPANRAYRVTAAGAGDPRERTVMLPPFATPVRPLVVELGE